MAAQSPDDRTGIGFEDFPESESLQKTSVAAAGSSAAKLRNVRPGSANDDATNYDENQRLQDEIRRLIAECDELRTAHQR
jgi:hypothetical protein